MLRPQRLALWAAACAALASSPAASQAPDLTTRELLSIMNERSTANNQRFDAQEKAVAAALSAAKEAVTKAEAAAEKRFDSVNEFRSTLKDQQLTLAPRAEVDVRIKSIESKIADLDERVTRLTGRGEGASWLWGVLSAAAGLVAGLVVAIMAVRRPIAG
jgi:Flp pilus assembly protein TadB